jgi:hypothetical protein
LLDRPFQPAQDIAELARLKILGGKLKKRSAARKEPAAAVLTAMQQARQESLGANAPGLASGDGGAGTGAAVAAAATGDGAAGAPALAPWTPPAGPGMASASGGAVGGWAAGPPLPATPVRHAGAGVNGGGGAAALAHLTSLRGAFTGLPYEEDDEGMA